MSARISSGISVSALTLLVQEYIPTIGDDAWRSPDQVYVVRKYKSFFQAVAKETPRLNAVMLGKILAEVFGTDAKTAGLCGTSMSQAFRHCWQAGQKMTDGSKTSQDVLSVVYCFPTAVPPMPKSLVNPEYFDTPIKQEIKQEQATAEKAKPIKKEQSNQQEHVDVHDPTAIFKLYNCGKSPPKDLKRKWEAEQCNMHCTCTRVYIYIYICTEHAACSHDLLCAPTHCSSG